MPKTNPNPKLINFNAWSVGSSKKVDTFELITNKHNRRAQRKRSNCRF